ncbi:20210_t:CDS:2, partial [Gigaspora rosea]
SIRCKENFDKARVVDLPRIKLPAATSRNKRSVQNPESCLVKSQKRKPAIFKTFESYYVLEILVENDDEGSTNVKKNPKQEEVLGSLADAYLEVYKEGEISFETDERKALTHYQRLTDDNKDGERNKDKLEVVLDGKVLHRACESWTKKVKEFRKMNK